MRLAHFLQAAELDTKLQIDAAVSAEKFDEAGTLQAEHDAAAADAAAIAAAHGFTVSDLGDALQSLSATPDQGAPGSSTAALRQPQGEPTQDNKLQHFSERKVEMGGPGLASMQAEGMNGDGVGAAEASREDYKQEIAPMRMQAAHAGPRASTGAQSASHVATDGSESVCSVSLASDGNLSSDADGHGLLPGVAVPAAGAALPQRPAAHARAAMQSAGSREALREAQLDRQLSEGGDSASGYMADSDSVRERLAPHGSHSSIDSIITGAGGLIRHPSGKLPPPGLTPPRAGRASEPAVHTLEEVDGEVGSSYHQVPTLDLEQIREGRENGSNSTGRGSDVGDFDALHSGREGYERGMFGGLSMAEAAHMHHIDNAGSTAGTMGGDSTQWGGSDAGAGDILGSARSLGGVPGGLDVPSEADEDAAESQDDVSVHGMHSGRDTPEVGGREGANLNGAHKRGLGRELTGEEGLARTHSSGSLHSFNNLCCSPSSKTVEAAGVGLQLLGAQNGAEGGGPEPAASGDMFAGLMLGGDV